MYFYRHKKINENEQNILLEMYCGTYFGFGNGWGSDGLGKYTI
jgi:hypothetical protein